MVKTIFARGNVVAPSSQIEWTDLCQILRFQSHITLTIYVSLFSNDGDLKTCIYRMAEKNGTKLFHFQNQEKMCNKTITKDPTTPQVCRYTTL